MKKISSLWSRLIHRKHAQISNSLRRTIPGLHLSSRSKRPKIDLYCFWNKKTLPRVCTEVARQLAKLLNSNRVRIWPDSYKVNRFWSSEKEVLYNIKLTKQYITLVASSSYGPAFKHFSRFLHVNNGINTYLRRNGNIYSRKILFKKKKKSKIIKNKNSL